MRFLAPMLNREKPAFVTHQLLKAIMESFLRIVWGHIIEDLVAKAKKKAYSKKGCSLPPLLHHLYARYDCFYPSETTMLRLAMKARRDRFPREVIPVARVPAAARLFNAAIAPRTGA